MADEFQVGCNLTRDEGRRLDEYARRQGLRRPALCALLVVRATRTRNLASLRSRFDPSFPKRGSVRVVARVSQAVQAEFRMIADAAEMGIDDAAAAVFRSELEQRWLERCLGPTADGNRP